MAQIISKKYRDLRPNLTYKIQNINGGKEYAIKKILKKSRHHRHRTWEESCCIYILFQLIIEFQILLFESDGPVN
jgi:hypothetical protein